MHFIIALILGGILWDITTDEKDKPEDGRSDERGNDTAGSAGNDTTGSGKGRNRTDVRPSNTRDTKGRLTVDDAERKVSSGKGQGNTHKNKTQVEGVKTGTDTGTDGTSGTGESGEPSS